MGQGIRAKAEWQGWFATLVIVLCCGGWQAGQAAPAAPLLLSEEPYASGRLLQAKLQPLLDYLNRHSVRADYLRTESYGQFLAHASRQQPDIALASAGMASLLVEHYGYRPVLVKGSPINAVVVVRAASPVQSLGQLAGGFILVPEPYDIVSELGRRLLRARGLEQQLLPRLVETPKVDRILLSVMNNEFDAGIVAGYDVSLLSPELRQNLRVIDRSEDITAHFILLRKALPAEDQARIVALLREFHRSAEGARYAVDFGSSQFVPFGPQHQRELDSFRHMGDVISNAP